MFKNLYNAVKRTIDEGGDVELEFSYDAELIALLNAKMPASERRWDGKTDLREAAAQHLERCKEFVKRL